MLRRRWLLSIQLAGVLTVAAAAASEVVRTEAVGLRFAVPSGWNRTPATSEMRAAQFRIPHAAADTEDAELVLFFFGPTQGGGAQQNLERWYAQFSQPDGRPSRDAAKVTTRTVNGLKVTAVDVTGTYLGGPGQPQSKPGWRMLAAVIEGDGGPWFFKATGPQATLEAAKPGFDAVLDSVERHK